MSRPTPRRPASSRGATPRPRKIAGQATTARPDAPVEVDDPDQPEGGEPGVAPLDADPREPDLDDWPADEPAGSGMLASPRVTRVLIGVLAALAVLLAAQAIWFVADDGSEAATARDDSRVAVPSGLPVVANDLAVQDGVEAAAKAALDIVAVDHKKYDEEVDAAAELMTTSFEEQYRGTAADIKDQLVEQETVVQANVVAQGVVRANRTELEALIFLNQVVQRVREGEPETVATPFKVLVKMVHTDQGWLVDGLETDGEQDKNN